MIFCRLAINILQFCRNKCYLPPLYTILASERTCAPCGFILRYVFKFFRCLKTIKLFNFAYVRCAMACWYYCWSFRRFHRFFRDILAKIFKTLYLCLFWSKKIINVAASEINICGIPIILYLWLCEFRIFLWDMNL